jgi:hypothetical protein
MKITLIMFLGHNTWYLTQLGAEFFRFLPSISLGYENFGGWKGYFNVAQDDLKFWSAEITGVHHCSQNNISLSEVSLLPFPRSQKEKSPPAKTAAQISSAKYPPSSLGSSPLHKVLGHKNHSENSFHMLIKMAISIPVDKRPPHF